MRRFVLLLCLVLPFTIFAQDTKESKQEVDEFPRVELLKTKRLVHHVYFGTNFNTAADSSGQYSSRQVGGYLGMEMAFHKYISFTDTTQFVGRIDDNNKTTAFLFAYYLGFRFYLGTPYVFIEPRIGMVDHFKYWDDQFYVEYATAALIGVSVPVTSKKDIMIDASFETRYNFYDTFKPKEVKLDKKLNYGFNIGVSFLLH